VKNDAYTVASAN